MDWEALAAPYFQDVVRSELNKYFRNHGFKGAATDDTAVRYLRDQVFVELAYMYETAPDYELTLSVGLVETDGLASRHLPIWTLVSAEEPRAWKFSDPEALRSVLRHLVSTVFESAVRPLWQNKDELENRLEALEAKLQESSATKQDGDILRRARSAFASKQFDEALAAYVLLDEEQLSDVDRRRVAWARDHSTPQNSER